MFHTLLLISCEESETEKDESNKKWALMKCTKHDCQLFAGALIWNLYYNRSWHKSAWNKKKNIQIESQQSGGGIGMWLIWIFGVFFPTLLPIDKACAIKIYRNSEMDIFWCATYELWYTFVWHLHIVAPSLFSSVTVCVPCILPKKSSLPFYQFANQLFIQSGKKRNWCALTQGKWNSVKIKCETFFYFLCENTYDSRGKNVINVSKNVC